MAPVLDVQGLKTHFFTDAGIALAVDGISFAVEGGKTLALVGESGCGKSVTALSILRLVSDPPGRIVAGQILLEGQDILALTEAEMRGIRGNTVSMIFQEPMTALNPVFRIGSQIAAVLRLHKGMTKAEARAAAVDLLARVGIASPEERAEDYAHQLSGGMRQRAMIAMALACGPRLLIADEPTTALDVTIQAQVLDLLRRLQSEAGMAILLITHDLGVVAEMAHDVAIMYAGQIVERAGVEALFASPKHPYTLGLFGARPRVDGGVASSAPKRLYAIKGNVPAATMFPNGCRFHPRCPHAMDVCGERAPALRAIAAGHEAACWLHDAELMAAQGRGAGLPAGEARR